MTPFSLRFLVVVLVPLLCGAPLLLLSAESPHPNILLIMSDDQGYGDFSIHGNPYLETPNLDRFAREGIQFSRFHVSPYCAPTRASLLTGRYSLRTGVTSVTANLEVMRKTEVTLAEALKPAGYRSTCIGKWHNGEQYPNNAIGQGFDEFFGFNGGHWNNYFDAELVRGTTPVKTKGFITDVLTDEAIVFMERNREHPFFCYLAYNAPHTPCELPDRFFTPFKAKGLDDYNASIYGMCANLDENFGRLIATLETLQLREDTIVLFLTDNGANGDRFNAGMRGWKTSAHEGGTRVPLFVQWPRKFQEPHVVDQLAAHFDLYPTLLELCGVSTPAGPPVDGISLVPWLEEKTNETVDRNILIHSAHPAPAVPFPGGMRTSRWRFVCEAPRARIENAPWQLYDMENDPGETTDLAARHPEVVEKLAAAYTEWWESVRGGSEPDFRIEVGHDEQNPVTLNAPQVSRRTGLKFGVRILGGKPDSPGFANDWLENWTRPEDRAEWNILVAQAGRYAVDLDCNVQSANAGAQVRVSAGDSSAEAITRAFPGEPLNLHLRVAEERTTFASRTWGRQRIGILELPAGPATLSIEALAIPGNEVMRLKSLTLTRLP